MTLERPEKIVSTRSDIAKYFGKLDLGTLLYLGLVRGRKLRRGSVVCIEDVEQCISLKKKLL